MKKFPLLAVAGATLAVYAAMVALGVRLPAGGLFQAWDAAPKSKMWRMEPFSSMTAEKRGQVEYGSRLFDETPVYASAYVKSRISCSNCHLEGGTAPYGLAVVGSVQAFPKYSPREKRVISLEDRVQECMTRSENGRTLPHDSEEMSALLAYITWLSEPHRGQQAFAGRGLETLRERTPNASHGATVYASQCAGCHGAQGEGARRPFPPLWGPDAFNDGAGMLEIGKMAAFVQYNMPHNRKGILSAQDAFDVAAYIHAQPRPAFNHEYDPF